MLSYNNVVSRMNYPLELKIMYSVRRIRESLKEFGKEMYVCYSGGKDSIVLLHLVRKIMPEIQAVFANTGLEYPDLVENVKNTENCITVRPSMSFPKVIEKYGYPVISKEVSRYIDNVRKGKSLKTQYTRIIGQNGAGKIPKKYMFLLNAPFKISDHCCQIMKKDPLKKYEKETGKKPFIGTRADESDARLKEYMKNGCNSFDIKTPQSRPIIFWTDKDIWEYIKINNLKYPAVYDKGIERTGCVFCGFGAHLQNPNSYQILEKHYPQLHKYCMDKLGFRDVNDFIGIRSENEII